LIGARQSPLSGRRAGIGWAVAYLPRESPAWRAAFHVYRLLVGVQH